MALQGSLARRNVQAARAISATGMDCVQKESRVTVDAPASNLRHSAFGTVRTAVAVRQIISGVSVRIPALDCRVARCATEGAVVWEMNREMAFVSARMVGVRRAAVRIVMLATSEQAALRSALDIKQKVSTSIYHVAATASAPMAH